MGRSDNSSGGHPDRDPVRFLSRREAYPHNPTEVTHIQTHISHVFIAPPFVFKIKKPVDFGFLDYSTLQKRKHFCEREVELNRRLCSGIYLGVVPVCRGDEGYVLDPAEEAGPVVEYAVKMRKLEERFFLHSYIEDGRLERRHLDRVADTLAGFYRGQDPGPEVLQWGEIEKVKVNTDENFRQTEDYIGRTIEREAYEAIRRYTDGYMDRRQALFRRRIDEKRIVDGHGDLHLDHIHITPEKVCIYDCIEFNKRFRYGDLAVDLAFLAMDLDFRECWKEERYFIDLMAEKLEDPELHRILDFYKCYRAYVKGKVKSLQSSEEEVSAEERRRAEQKAAEYFDLSLRYALLGSEPSVLVVMGRVGTGKSTLAGHLGRRLGIEHYSSDRIRKSLAGLPLTERPSGERRRELYSTSMSEKTYGVLLDRFERHRDKGESCILDATFSNRRGREELREKLESSQVRYLFIEARADDETLRNRLRSRENAGDVISDARLEDFEMLSRKYDPPNEIEPEHLIGIDTGRPMEETLRELYRQMVERHLASGDR